MSMIGVQDKTTNNLKKILHISNHWSVDTNIWNILYQMIFSLNNVREDFSVEDQNIKFLPISLDFGK